MMQLLHKIRHLYLVHLRWRRYIFGRNIYIGRAVYMWAKHCITIGDNFYIGKFSQIECDSEIGNNVMLANYVALIGRHDHDYSEIGVPTRLAGKIRDDDYKGKGLNEKVIIEDDVWIGHGSIILSGVRIGQGSIIAAGSVVTRDIEPFTVCGGNPARKIKLRFDTDEKRKEHIRQYAEKYGNLSMHNYHDANDPGSVSV